MRLLHLLAETGYSGGEVQLRHLLAHLQARGHDNHLCLPRGARFAAAAAELGVPTHHAALRRGAAWPGTWWTLRALARSLRPDVLHFACGRSLVVGGLAALGLRVPLRFTTRRIDYPIGRSLFRGGRYRRLVDHVIANCEAVRRRVLDAGVAPERVTLVHEGIDVRPWQGIRQDRAAARARLGLPGDALVVSCAATLRPRKGQALLIDAFAALAARQPRAVLVLAGDGSDRERLRRKAAATGLSARIRIPGALRPVRDLYAASDLFCMPSFHEGLSNACLEASAAGLPLLVTAAGGLPEIVADGQTGAVVPPGDVAGLTAALARYLADGGLRDRAGAAGALRTASLFTAERMARATEALLLSLLEKA